jgi:hypothetical protein
VPHHRREPYWVWCCDWECPGYLVCLRVEKLEVEKPVAVKLAAVKLVVVTVEEHCC